MPHGPDSAFLRKYRLHIGRYETGQVISGTVKSKDFAQPRTADREIPAFPRLRLKERQAPRLERGTDASDHITNRGVQPGAERRILNLWPVDA